MHGTAMYVKDFTADIKSGKRYFLRFDGVGTYATIKVNGTDFGRHPVGRTTLTLDVTDAMKQGTNRLEVKAEHPEMIADMLGYVVDVRRSGDSVKGHSPSVFSVLWCWR